VQGRLDEAEQLAASILAIQRRIASSQEGTARTLFILGRVKVEKGKIEEGEPLLREAWQLFSQYAPSKRDFIAQAANWLGATLVARQAYPEAENLLVNDADLFFARTTLMSSAERRAAVGHIVQLYQGWNKPEKVAFWQNRLNELNPTAAK
jgi:hypothetical protein